MGMKKLYNEINKDIGLKIDIGNFSIAISDLFSDLCDEDEHKVEFTDADGTIINLLIRGTEGEDYDDGYIPGENLVCYKSIWHSV